MEESPLEDWGLKAAPHSVLHFFSHHCVRQLTVWLWCFGFTVNVSMQQPVKNRWCDCRHVGVLTHVWELRFWFPMSQQFVSLQIVLKAPCSRNENTQASREPTPTERKRHFDRLLTSRCLADWSYLPRSFTASSKRFSSMAFWTSCVWEQRSGSLSAVFFLLPKAKNLRSTCEAEGVRTWQLWEWVLNGIQDDFCLWKQSTSRRVSQFTTGMR